MKSLRGLVVFFSGFRVRGPAGSMRSQGLGFKAAFWVEAAFRIQGLELRALGLRVWVAGFRVSLDARQPTLPEAPYYRALHKSFKSLAF